MTSPRYRPLDEVLARPRMRILRALRRFDLASSLDLFLASSDEHNRMAWSNALTHLVRGGLVERVPVRERGYNDRAITVSYYRITPAGLAEIEQLRADYECAMEVV